MKKTFNSFTRTILVITALLSTFTITSCTKKETTSTTTQNATTIKIGISKIVQHVALDSIEQGIQDAINDAGIIATFDLQNANGDVNTAA